MNSPRGEKLVSATELIRESLSMLYVARWKIITISAPLFLLSLASTVFDRDITELAREIISYGILIVGIITQLSLVSLAIAYHRGEEEFPRESFFRAMGLISSYLAILILMYFVILGGFIAFIVPNIITLSLFVTYLTLIFVPAIFAGLYSERITGKASFYSILIPIILLIVLFPIVGKNTFLITTLSAVLIILFYDKIFKRKQMESAPLTNY